MAKRALPLVADCCLILLTVAAALWPAKAQRPWYETQARVYQRWHLHDRHGDRYALKLITRDGRMFTFSEQDYWQQFAVDNCAIIVTKGAETSLRPCR